MKFFDRIHRMKQDYAAAESFAFSTTHYPAHPAHPVKKSPGFTLLEVMVVVLIIAIALPLSGMVFKRMMDVSRGATKTEQLTAKLDRINDQLRADVWNSYDMAVGDERTLILRQAGEQTISWQTSADGRTLRRTVTQRGKAVSYQLWQDLPTFTFAGDNVAVIVRIAGDDLRRPGEVQLTSQVRVVGGLLR